MSDVVAFSTLDPDDETPVCSLCGRSPGAFEYDLNSDDTGFHEMQGYCCLHCADNLLAAMEKVESAKSHHQPRPLRHLGLFAN